MSFLPWAGSYLYRLHYVAKTNESGQSNIEGRSFSGFMHIYMYIIASLLELVNIYPVYIYIVDRFGTQEHLGNSMGRLGFSWAFTLRGWVQYSTYSCGCGSPYLLDGARQQTATYLECNLHYLAGSQKKNVSCLALPCLAMSDEDVM